MVLLDGAGQLVEEVPRLREELSAGFWEVPDDAAEPEVVEHQPLARQVFQQVLNALAVVDRVHERRGEVAVHVERERRQREHVRRDPTHLRAHGPDHLRVLGDLDVGEVLGRPRVRPLVEQARRDVVPAIGVRHDLVAVRARLGHLLLTAVEVADVRLHVDHLLAVEDRLQMEDAVGRRVVRSDVEEHRVRLGVTVVVLERVRVLRERGDLRAIPVVVHRQRVALPRLWKEDPAEVGVVVVLDPDQVVRLPLVPVRRAEHRFARLRDRTVLVRGDDDADLLGRVVELLQVVDRFVSVLVLLSGDEREVVVARLRLQRREGLLDRVRPDHEAGRVQVVVAVDDEVAEQHLQLVGGALGDSVRLCGVWCFEAHGESAKLYRMTSSSSSIWSASVSTSSSFSRSENSSSSYGFTVTGAASPFAMRSWSLTTP